MVSKNNARSSAFVSALLLLVLLTGLVAGCSSPAPAAPQAAPTTAPAQPEPTKPAPAAAPAQPEPTQAPAQPEPTKAPTQPPPTAAPTAEPVLEYTFLDTVHATAPFGYNNPNDIVTPWVEKKFNIKVKDVVFAAGQTPVQRVNMMIAAGNLPDVVVVDNPDVAVLYATGQFADLSQYKDLLVNTDKFVSDYAWKMLSVDGKLAALPVGAEPDLSNPEVKAIADKDQLFAGSTNWALMVREDILKQLGYKFKTIKQLQGELDAAPRKLSDADLVLDPPLKTPEDFEKLLYAIKALNLKVNGKPVIPLSIPDWGAYHMSVLYSQTGGFMVNPDTMKVTGFADNPNMKEFYTHFHKWFQDGVLDNDWLIQKPEQLQEKIASGRVAVIFYAPDFPGARTNLASVNPEWDLRPIPWPASLYETQTGRASYVDPSYPQGFYNLMINKNVKDIPRLLKYFDWSQTEEAMDMSVWGPESAGLWEIKDGKKVFKDQALWEAIRDGKKTADGRNAEYYGIYDKNNTVSYYTSKAFLTSPAPFYNYLTYERSYPIKMDAWDRLRNTLSTIKLCRNGQVLPANGEKPGATSNYYWSEWRTTKVAELLGTQTGAEFDAKWDEILAEFKTKSGYDEAITALTPLFKQALGK